MAKHILGMALYALIVLFIILFGGEHIIPEPNIQWRFERSDSRFVFPGRLYDWDQTPLYSEKEKEFGPSRHFTNVFNIFVMIILFKISVKEIHIFSLTSRD